MSTGTKETSKRDAFLFGIAGAVISALLFICFTVGVSINSTLLTLVLLPLLAAFLCSAVVGLLRPTAPISASSLGYASVWGILALPAVSDAPVFGLLLLFAAATLLMGYLGQVAVRRCYPRKFVHASCPGEPACPRCGYILYYVQDHRCPECDQPFLDAEVNIALAYWENGVLKPKSAQGASDLSQEERLA